MNRYERIIKMPAVVMSKETAGKIAGMLHDLAEKRVTSVLRERMRQANVQSQGLVLAAAGQSVSSSPPNDVLVEQYVVNESYRELIRPAFGDKYTFLSPHGNVQFLYNDFEYGDIPPDPVNLIVESGGPQGEILNLNIKANTVVADFADSNINRILIQGPDSAWVNDICDRLRVLVQASKEPIRNLVYHWMPFFIWLTFFACTAIEYKIVRLTSTFRWNVPLNGLQLIAIFVVFAVTLIASANLFTRTLPFLYPYFELEGTISRRRKAWRKPVVVAITILYGAAITMLFAVR